VGLWLSASWPWWASLLTERGLGEPISLLEGISVWSTVALRAMSIFLGLCLVFYALDRLKTDLKDREGEMHLQPCIQDWKGPSPWLVARRCRWLVDRLYEMASLLLYRPKRTLNRGNDTPKTSNSEQTSEDQFDKLWNTYNYYGQKHWRLARAVIFTLAIMFLWWILPKTFGAPTLPARGPVAHFFYKWTHCCPVKM
jgi:hypothetical protein